MDDSFVIPIPPPENFSSSDFERAIAAFVTKQANTFDGFDVKHLATLSGADGDYEIDVLASFAFMGMDFRVLIECKKQGRSVEREVVQVLYDRIRAVGAHKGAIFSTAGFQAGAIRYATEHGIALIRVFSGQAIYETRGFGSKSKPLIPDLPEFAIQRYVMREEHALSGRRYLGREKTWLEEFIEEDAHPYR